MALLGVAQLLPSGNFSFNERHVCAEFFQTRFRTPVKEPHHTLHLTQEDLRGGQANLRARGPQPLLRPESFLYLPCNLLSGVFSKRVVHEIFPSGLSNQRDSFRHSGADPTVGRRMCLSHIRMRARL